MTSRRPEFAVGIALVVVFLAFWAWQAPGPRGRLTPGEVDAYIRRLQGQMPASPAQEIEFLGRLRAWGNADDGRPVYMLNVMTYYAQLKSVPGGAGIVGTPVEANATYEDAIKSLVLRLGAYPLFAGEADGIGPQRGQHRSLTRTDAAIDDSDRILVMRYPNRRAFFRLITDPAYLKVVPYKFAAVELGLVPMSARLSIPDARWMLGGLFAMLFLGFGWLRAARRSRPSP